MNALKKVNEYFSLFEKLLWIISITANVIVFFAFKNKDYLTLASCLTGVTAIILCAKGNPLGMALCVIFASFYGFVSFLCGYYGEVITYVGMSLPMSVLSLISWLKNRYRKTEVKVAELTKNDIYLLSLFAVIVTILFFFILKLLSTNNLIVSTISITTSFIAVYLTYKRSPFFALAYAVNDVVLIVLWTVESVTNISCVPIVSCFATFLVTDLYGFFNWLKMKNRQSKK